MVFSQQKLKLIKQNQIRQEAESLHWVKNYGFTFEKYFSWDKVHFRDKNNFIFSLRWSFAKIIKNKPLIRSLVDQSKENILSYLQYEFKNFNIGNLKLIDLEKCQTNGCRIAIVLDEREFKHKFFWHDLQKHKSMSSVNSLYDKSKSNILLYLKDKFDNSNLSKNGYVIEDYLIGKNENLIISKDGFKHKVRWSNINHKTSNYKSLLDKSKSNIIRYLKFIYSLNVQDYISNGNNLKLIVKCNYNYLHKISTDNIKEDYKFWYGSLLDKLQIEEYKKINPYNPFENCRPDYKTYVKNKLIKKPETQFHLYLLKCTSDVGEEFLQFGCTKNIKSRHGSPNKFSKSNPYKYEIINIITKNSELIVDGEEFFKRLIKSFPHYKYSFEQIHGYKFNGHTECVKIEYKDMWMEMMEGYKETIYEE